MASIVPGAPKLVPGTSRTHRTLLASVPQVIAECLPPVCINQWLALAQGLPNRCQAHDERTPLLLESVPGDRRVPVPRWRQPMASIAPGAPRQNTRVQTPR